MTDKLKYEDKFQAVDLIRAYDFQPREGVEDRYIQGIVIGKQEVREMGYAKCYLIKITSDSGKDQGGRVGDTGYIPMEVSFGEYDGRVIKIA